MMLFADDATTITGLPAWANYLIGGGGLAAAGAAARSYWQPALDFLQSGRADRRKAYEERAKAEAGIIARLEAKIEQLEREVTIQKERIYHLEATRREIMRHPMWSMSNRGARFTFANAAFVEQVLVQSGRVDGDVLGMTVEEVFAGNPEAAAVVKALMKQAAYSSMGQSFAAGVPLVPGGIPWSVAATPIFDESRNRSGYSLIAILETPVAFSRGDTPLTTPKTLPLTS